MARQLLQARALPKEEAAKEESSREAAAEEAKGEEKTAAKTQAPRPRRWQRSSSRNCEMKPLARAICALRRIGTQLFLLTALLVQACRPPVAPTTAPAESGSNNANSAKRSRSKKEKPPGQRPRPTRLSWSSRGPTRKSRSLRTSCACRRLSSRASRRGGASTERCQKESRWQQVSTTICPLPFAPFREKRGLR